MRVVTSPVERTTLGPNPTTSTELGGRRGNLFVAPRNAQPPQFFQTAGRPSSAAPDFSGVCALREAQASRHEGPTADCCPFDLRTSSSLAITERLNATASAGRANAAAAVVEGIAGEWPAVVERLEQGESLAHKAALNSQVAKQKAADAVRPG
jgi:hypothetical protein